MISKISRNRFIILITFLIALMLDILPLPETMIWIRPKWTLLVLIYWVMALPYVVSVAYAFLIGILLDLLHGTLLGEHAFAMIIVTYVVAKFYNLIRVHSLLQQTIFIFGLVLLYQALIFIIQVFIGQMPHKYLYWGTTITTTILWPWMFILLRDCRRRFLIS